MSQSHRAAGHSGLQSPIYQKGKLRHKAKKGFEGLRLCLAPVPAAALWVRPPYWVYWKKQRPKCSYCSFPVLSYLPRHPPRKAVGCQRCFLNSSSKTLKCPHFSFLICRALFLASLWLIRKPGGEKMIPGTHVALNRHSVLRPENKIHPILNQKKKKKRHFQENALACPVLGKGQVG